MIDHGGFTPTLRRDRLGAFSVAGLSHFCGPSMKNIQREAAADVELTLVRQPDNAHDRNAIRLELPSGTACGWVPRSGNAEPARLMDLGVHVTARILSVRWGAPENPYHEITAALEVVR